ncbi:MAG: histidinol-phosphate transaminase [Puniceicoccales bacterium]|jgi:histidinol-phosphate aminotransferase|nr:histidinol-phosphate transaminase [Puniceicoccales bacterium]
MDEEGNRSPLASPLNLETLGVDLATAAVAALPGYVPGEQPQEAGWLKLNTNENPYPPSPAVAEAIRRELGADGASLRLYPNPRSSPLRAAAAAFHGRGLTEQNVVAGNGSDDVLNLLARAYSDAGKSAGMLMPSYSLYPVIAGQTAASLREVPVAEDGEFEPERVAGSGANIFFLTNPNAPLGVVIDAELILETLRRFRGILVVDEAYAPFAPRDCVGLLAEFPNLVITRTFSKAYSLAGLRAGYALASPSVAAVLDKVRDSYNLDRLAQVAAVAALGDRDYYAGTIAAVCRTRDATAAALRGRGWRVLPSGANFIAAEPPPPFFARDVAAFLRDRKILVRHFAKSPFTVRLLRITIGTDAEMARFFAALDELR